MIPVMLPAAAPNAMPSAGGATPAPASGAGAAATGSTDFFGWLGTLLALAGQEQGGTQASSAPSGSASGGDSGGGQAEPDTPNPATDPDAILVNISLAHILATVIAVPEVTPAATREPQAEATATTGNAPGKATRVPETVGGVSIALSATSTSPEPSVVGPNDRTDLLEQPGVHAGSLGVALGVPSEAASFSQQSALPVSQTAGRSREEMLPRSTPPEKAAPVLGPKTPQPVATAFGDDFERVPAATLSRGEADTLSTSGESRAPARTPGDSALPQRESDSLETPTSLVEARPSPRRGAVRLEALKSGISSADLSGTEIPRAGPPPQEIPQAVNPLSDAPPSRPESSAVSALRDPGPAHFSGGGTLQRPMTVQREPMPEPLSDSLAIGAPAVVTSVVAAPHSEPRKEGESRREPPDSPPHPTPAVAPLGDPPPVREFGAARVEHEAPHEVLSPAGMDRILGGARVSVSQGGMEVRLRLHPESLGEVRVQVRWEGGMLSARLQADSPTARDALQAAAPGLHAALRDQGIPVGRLTIGVGIDLDARSHGQSFASQSGPAPGRVSTGAGETPSEPEPEPASTGRVDVRI